MQITWADDESAAYLIDENGNIVGRWFRDRPGMSTFDPATYTYGQGYGYQGPGQGQSHMYNAWQGGGGNDGFLQEQWRLTHDEGIRQWEIEREATQRAHDDWIAQDEKRLAQDIELKRMEIAASTGEIRLQHELELVEMERQHQYDVQYLQLDYAERHKILDKEIAQMDRQMWSNERLAAAQMSAQPQNYRMYEHWMAGLGGQADPSGLPPGAPGFQTGPGMEGAVAGGDVVGASPYAQAYASGQRIPEFQAYGGPSGPVGGDPWVSPHKMNLTQFAGSPLQSQEMQYGRWRERGFMPYTAEQQMRAAAPTGTAGQRVPSYG